MLHEKRIPHSAEIRLGHPFIILSVHRAVVQLIMRADQTARRGHVKISQVLDDVP